MVLVLVCGGHKCHVVMGNDVVISNFGFENTKVEDNAQFLFLLSFTLRAKT